MAPDPTSSPSTPSLIGKAIREATSLVTTEIALARLEASEKVTLALASVVSLVAAAIFIMVALVFLLQGVVELLIANGFATYAASFTVGGVIAGVALVAAFIAKRNLTAARLKPTRTLGQIETAKDAMRGRTR